MSMKIDCHVHLSGVSEKNGCYLSSRMRRSFSIRYYFWKFGMQKMPDEEAMDRRFVDILAKSVGDSELDRAVLLGLDGVYSEDGAFDSKKTHVVVPNDYVKDVCAAYPNRFLYGASVHPYRKDALDELERIKEGGAVLVKLLPNSQGFDPGDPDIETYYKKLAELQLPLLIHCGYEHTIPPIDQAFGWPRRLEMALDTGLRVIVAHVGSAGLAHVHETMGETLELMTRYPNCYGDTAAFCSLWRGKYLLQLLDEERLYRMYKVKLDDPMSRLIHGSDFPIPISLAVFFNRLKKADRRAIRDLSSELQKDIALKRLLGVPETCLTLAHDIFGMG
jgi:predicted TIM-barrel fold metal-dependent hydrolase